MGKKLTVLDFTFLGALLAVFAGIVIHAPLTVFLSSRFPEYDLLIKSWKEIILGVALLTSVVIITMKMKWSEFLSDRLLVYIALFALLNLFVIGVAYTGFEATVAGLFINLRFLLFFALVFVALKLYPQWHKKFVTVFFAGAAVVIGFSILQITVLPNDFLKYLGYSKDTISPYLTVDENQNYVRINSTLRGPNPLGVYAVIVLSIILTAWFKVRTKFTRKQEIWGGVLAGGAVVALWASYSRSAALAALAAVAIILISIYGKKVSRRVWIILGVVGLVLVGSLAVLRDTSFVSQVILHEDPAEGNSVNSNDGHYESLVTGLQRMAVQPLGAGIGSTGSASLLTDNPMIIENTYLMIAHETGWLGLVLFVYIFWIVLVRLWRARKQHWLAFGTFASGVGLAIAGLFLPVWADDTVSIIWWGLAAIALTMPEDILARAVKVSKTAKTTVKKKVKKS